MKLGVLTAIFDGMSFEEVVDFARKRGILCWNRRGAPFFEI